MKSRFFLFRWISGILKFFLRPFIKPFKKLFVIFMDKTKKSIRMELIIAFAICLLGATIVYGMSGRYFRRTGTYNDISYDEDILSIAQQASALAGEFNTQKPDLGDKDKISAIISRRNGYAENKVMITDMDGRILYKNENVSETQVDIYSVIKNAMEVRQISNFSSGLRADNRERKEFVSFYPISLKDSTAYLIVKGIPQGRVITRSYDTSQNNFFALIVAVGAFILMFIFITNKKMRYIEEISSGLVEISKGNLKFRVTKRGEDELSLLADYINHMAEEIETKIEHERKAERTKAELITNVSHDLRTPLTSIMGYLGLIKEKRYTSEEQMNEYVDIAVNKTEKLKVLIEDLFEYTKLSNEGIKFYPQVINLGEFLEQLAEELIPLCEENGMSLRKDIPAERFMVNVDTDKMLRVFENLITNAIKYSYKPGDIIMKLYRNEDEIVTCIVNKGPNIPQQELAKLFERFYRVDKARTTSTGGSGLGLAIAKNIVDLSGGRIWAECEEEEIRFFVALKIV